MPSLFYSATAEETIIIVLKINGNVCNTYCSHVCWCVPPPPPTDTPLNLTWPTKSYVCTATVALISSCLWKLKLWQNPGLTRSHLGFSVREITKDDQKFGTDRRHAFLVRQGRGLQHKLWLEMLPNMSSHIDLYLMVPDGARFRYKLMGVMVSF